MYSTQRPASEGLEATSVRHRRCALLLNANAKRFSQHLVRRLNGRGLAQDVFVTDTLHEAQIALRTILDKKYSILMIGGGDGTIASTLQMLVQAQVSSLSRSMPDIALMPLGTGNALASWLNLSSTIDDFRRLQEEPINHLEELRVLENPLTQDIFFLGSVGYDAQVLNDYVDMVQATPAGWRRRLAKSLPGYLYAIGTRTLAAERQRGPTRVEVRAKGAVSYVDYASKQEVSMEADSLLFAGIARAVLMGTVPNYGFGMKVLPQAVRRNDRFHVRISTAEVSHIFANLRGIWSGTESMPHFLDFLVEDVDVHTSQPLPLQLSGDAHGHVQHLRARLGAVNFRLVTASDK